MRKLPKKKSYANDSKWSYPTVFSFQPATGTRSWEYTRYNNNEYVRVKSIAPFVGLLNWLRSYVDFHEATETLGDSIKAIDRFKLINGSYWIAIPTLYAFSKHVAQISVVGTPAHCFSCGVLDFLEHNAQNMRIAWEQNYCNRV